MPEIKPIHLVMVTSGANNNKYYDMTPNGDSWTATYGRVGSSPQKRVYSIGQWNSKYNEKIRKGYVDQTDLIDDLVTIAKETKSGYKEIENMNIADIVERLQKMAKQAISDNYNVSSNKVTQAMVDEAQKIIDGLVKIKDTEDVDKFNNELIRLFTTIPRSMSSVSDYIAKDEKQLARIIDREQALLDVMRGQVVQKKIVDDAQEDDAVTDKTILDQLGLVFEECNASDIAMIKKSLGSCSDKFKNAWKVTNIKTQKRFDDYVSKNKIDDIRLLFHGSRNENWWSIIQSGLVLRPTNAIITGKMFGYGIYYAPKAQKSLGYTSLSGSYWARGDSNSGFMALMNVAYGKPYDVYSGYYGNFNYDALQRACPGANCLHAHAGTMLRNDEIIIYKEDQCTIKYLVELGY